MLFFAVLAFIHYKTTAENIPIEVRPKYSPAFANVASALAIVIFIFAFYTINVKAFLENRMLIIALQDAGQGKIENSLNDFKNAISYNSIGTREAREQLAQLATQIVGRENLPVDLRQNIAFYAISEFKHQLEISPTDARYYLFLSVVYNSIGDAQNAEASIKKALENSPKKQQILLQLAEVYYRQGKFDQAVETVKNIIDISPPNYPYDNHSELESSYIMVAIAAGKDELASQEIAKLLSHDTPTDDYLKRWANAYASRQQFDKVAALYEELNKRNPKDAQIITNLASAYLAAGFKNNAILLLKKAINNNPDFKAQGEKFIEQIKESKNAGKP